MPPRNNTSAALERLGYLISNGTIDQLKQALAEFDQCGLQKEKLINYPIQRYNGRTAVHLAASNGLYDCLELLLKCGGNPNAQSSPTDLNQTPLHLAASKGYPRCIQSLLDHGARMDLKNTHRATAYDLVKGKVTCEKVFQHAIARYQIPQRTNQQQKRVEALHEIIGVGEPLEEFYRLYEQLPADQRDLATRWTDFYQQTLLYRATSSELFEVVEFMLSFSKNQPLHNLDTNETPLLIACRKQLHSIAKILLDHSPKLLFVSDARNSLSPLHVACSKGDTVMVRLLLETIKKYINSSDFDDESEVSLDFRDELGRTPLFNACYYGFFDVVKQLVDFQRENNKYVTFNVNAAVKNTQRTPLHVAVRKGSYEIVQLLLTIKGIEINVEARPSGRTQTKLVDNFQKNRYTTVLPEPLERQSTIPEDEVFVQDRDEGDRAPSLSPHHHSHQSPLSPPGTRTPTDSISSWSELSTSVSITPHSSNTSLVSTHIDDCIGFVAPVPSELANHRMSTGHISPKPSTGSSQGGGKRSYATLPTKHVPSKKPSSATLKRFQALDEADECSDSGLQEEDGTQKSRAQTDTRGMDAATSNLRVLETIKTGKFQFQVRKPSDTLPSTLRDFDDLLVTPLAEACVCYHTKIMKLLLLHGARDNNGLASRIAYLIQKPELIKLVLSYHTVLKEEIPDEEFENLELTWSHMKLSLCKGEWVGPRAEFYPSNPGQDMDVIRGGGKKRRRKSVAESLILKTTPDNVVRLDAIRVIHLDNNQLTSVPMEIFQLQNVRKIVISNNKITHLPSPPPSPDLPPSKSADTSSDYGSDTGGRGWMCPSLEELIVSKNELTHVPVCVWELPSLRKFICSKNKLKMILLDNDSISDVVLTPSLEMVDLSVNQLQGVVPRFLFELPALRQLNLSENQITELPETLWDCDTLQEANFSSNQLSSLPWCEPQKYVENSSSFQGTSSQHVPMKQAEKVLMGKVEFKPGKFDRNRSIYQRAPSTVKPLTFSQELSEGHTLDTCEYSSLQKLNLSNNVLAHFPEALACFAPNLTELDVSRNPLQSIDVQFIPFPMKKLTAKKCKLEIIGNVIPKARQLQVNQSCRHSSSKGMACQHRNHLYLPYLTVLDVSENMLKHVQLIRRQAHDDSIDFGAKEKIYDSKIAPNLDLLYPALEGLNVSSNNLLGRFNPNIGHQAHLKWIRLSNNRNLLEIPMEFAYLKNTKQLTELQMKNLENLVEPPPEYQEVGLSHLLTYMRSRLKESNYYRSIKLFFIGNGERGKTTLLRRLRSMKEDKHVERTAGIDIETWTYPETSGRSLFKDHRKPVTFLAWDFAGQDVYHTTHQCFYSKRSMYLALFRLCDGEKGIEELEQWLRSVQLRAPGCPVIIVGTHLDAIKDDTRVKDLETKAMKRFSNSPHYPRIVGVVSICCLRKLFNNQMENLRTLIYNVACHLALGKDGNTLEYKPDLAENDPKALFQQLIPQTFLSLQDRIRDKVGELKAEGKSPIMEDSQFRVTFKELFEDEDELDEAVYFLNLQGTLLHFPDHSLKNIYFLDPQWLAKLMADVIHPSAMGTATHIRDGVAEITGLFSQRDIPTAMKDRYISLLEKFEIALKINPSQMIIPSLMLEQASYPKPDDRLTDMPGALLDEIESFYQPPLRRFWLADFVPAGFWPRLICRVATDHQIGRVLRTILGGGSSLPFSESLDGSVNQFGGPVQSEGASSNSSSLGHRNGGVGSPTRPGEGCGREILNWTPWKTGMAFSYRGRTLMVMKQITNEPCEDFTSRWDLKVRLEEAKHRIEVHIYINEWVALTNELLELNVKNSLPMDSYEVIPGLATKLLVMVTGHVKDLALSWFPGMLKAGMSHPFLTYLPCWKCYAEIGTPKPLNGGTMKGKFVCKNKNPISCFLLDDNVVSAALGKSLECCIHGNVKIMHMAPDLIFWDLTSDMSHSDSTAPLHICEDEVLGKGGFGFVCKGEIQVTTATGMHVTKKNVAVKVFLQNISDLPETTSISELLELSKKPQHLQYAYKEIRQEVSFLSNLDHPNLTKLCGVRTSPYMCLVLELAPKKSLRAALKEYRECSVALEPLTLKNTALQIAQGLEYLHSHQVVHLDMKSPNVLLWHFPSPYDDRQVRIRQSGNVWIKIADYGISQVSTELMLRVDNSPVGTPGFMAPELFDKAGQLISSEKVDVFAYGMVLYELLSQRSPFDDCHPPIRRNREVREGQRPILQARETRTLIQLQDLMKMCWDKEPENRPKMEQIVEWIRAPEFERLRAEIALREVKSISCAVVCRILPENETRSTSSSRESSVHNSPNHAPPMGVIYGPDGRLLRDSGSLDEIGTFDSLIEEYGGTNTSIDLIVPNMLPSISMDSICIESMEGNKISNEGDDIYQFVPSQLKRGRGSSHGSKYRRKGTLNSKNAKKSDGGVASIAGGGGSVDAEEKGTFDPYTQIWMCGRDQRKGLLQIFTYIDGHPGQYLFSGYCSRDEITSMCAVRNMMWMGTSAGAIKVFHAPTLKTKFTCTLNTEESGSIVNRTILDILYVEELKTVLVASFSGEVWCFYDTIVEDGLRLQCKIELADGLPCYHMAKVVLEGGRRVEVWGTMENNRLLILDKPHGIWHHQEIVIKPKDPKLRLCSYVAFTSFTNSLGAESEHVWVSYRQRTVLVSFDARKREQRCILNCAEKLKTETNQSFQITTLTCTGRKVLVGTTIGAVAIFDSETVTLLNYLNWHKDKVRTLLVMPRQVDPCICAEIPFPRDNLDSISSGAASSVTSSTSLPLRASVTGSNNNISSSIPHASPSMSRKRAYGVKKQLAPQPQKNFVSQFSYLENEHCIMNSEPDSIMLTSVGNGKQGYSVNVESKEDRVNMFNDASKRRSAYRGTPGGHGRQNWEDIVLLTWKI